jgi:hypothetical protein
MWCSRDFHLQPTPPPSSDVLAHSTASDISGVAPSARSEVLERVSEQFLPGLLNRLDSMIIFNRVLRVVNLHLGDVSARLAQRRIKMSRHDNATTRLSTQPRKRDVLRCNASLLLAPTPPDQSPQFPLCRKSPRTRSCCTCLTSDCACGSTSSQSSTALPPEQAATDTSHHISHRSPLHTGLAHPV